MKKKKIELSKKLMLNKVTIANLSNKTIGGWAETDRNHGCVPATGLTDCLNSVCPDHCVPTGNHTCWCSVDANQCVTTISATTVGQSAIKNCQPQTVMVGGTC